MLKDRFYGTIFGQAIGDALGLGSEFMSKEEVDKFYPTGLREYSQIIQDDHRCRWAKGAWTDDTDMMLCIMDGLIENQGAVNLHSIAENFEKWFNGNPLGVGRHTYNVLCMSDYLTDPIRCAEIIWTLYKKRSAANGGVMRTSVVGLIKDYKREYAEDICRLTHPDKRCVGSAVMVSEIIHELVYNDHELTYDEIIEIADKYDERIKPFVELARDATDTDQLELLGIYQGYTLKTLSAALWTYWHCKTFEEGLLEIVNAGGDADTNAAVACSILGAKYGYSNIPKYYRENLHQKDKLMARIDNLYAICS